MFHAPRPGMSARKKLTPPRAAPAKVARCWGRRRAPLVPARQRIADDGGSAGVRLSYGVDKRTCVLVRVTDEQLVNIIV